MQKVTFNKRMGPSGLDGNSLHKDVTGELVTPPIFCDNNGALKNICSGVSSAKTKHIDVRFHDSRELHAQGIVEFAYVSTNDNLADIMTKALRRNAISTLLRVWVCGRVCDWKALFLGRVFGVFWIWSSVCVLRASQYSSLAGFLPLGFTA